MTPRKPVAPIATDGADAAPEAVLRVRGVTKNFGGAAALKGVDLDLYPGEIHALMGMNGAGKSTLVQILSGSTRPTAAPSRSTGRRSPDSPCARHAGSASPVYPSAVNWRWV